MASPAYDLSILIPARNEFYHDIDLLHQTITNVLANTGQSTEVLVVLDGYDDQWPPTPLPVDSRLTVINHRTSIGQRAACNEAARVSKAKFICKLDAHCAVDKDFDVKMMRHCDYLTTLIPVQYNLHAFSWACKKCRHETYQGPKPPRCEKCGSRYLKLVPKWLPRGWKERDGVWEGRPKTTAWRFDSTLHFQYWGEFQSRPEGLQRPLSPTMSCLGACWMLQRERYRELEGMDEKHGSWGQMGTELACKTWLSGGQMLVNHETWFAHLFRTQPSFGFPYANPGIDRARARSRELWLNNKWSKAKYPLSWLLQKFKDVPDWHSIKDSPVLATVNEAGASFRPVTFLSNVVTCTTESSINSASPVRFFSSAEKVSTNTSSLAPVDNGDRLRVSANILPVIRNKSDVERITAGGIIADRMIENGDISTTASGQRGNKPGVHIPMGQLDVPAVPVGDMAVSVPVAGTNPDPAVKRPFPFNPREDTLKFLERGSPDSQSSVSHGLTITNSATAGYLYYTCGTHDEILERAARNNLMKHKQGNEIGCVSLVRTDFGDWTIVLNRERSPATMHYQILAGLERMRADYVFLCESDVFYDGSHFHFIPPDNETIWYNTNVWRIRYADGHAVRTDNLQQVSGICANRELLLAHYRKRIEWIEANGGVFDVKRIAYEPGTRGDLWQTKIATWESEYPNVDVTGHGKTLTTPHFSIDSFRNKKYAQGWAETDDPLPGWPTIAGRVQEWLSELASESQNGR